ncbi:MAG: hypothetical protein ACJ74W_12420 [Pyrinomonadaceae bacterium]
MVRKSGEYGRIRPAALWRNLRREVAPITSGQRPGVDAEAIRAHLLDA